MSEPSAGNSELSRRRGTRLVPKMLRPASGKHRKVATGATAMLALAAGAVPVLLHASTGGSAASISPTPNPTAGVNQPRATTMSSLVCNGWSSCTSKGYNSYGYGAHEWTMYWRMYGGSNCTNYAAYVESTVYHVATPSYLLGNGGQWAVNARAHGVVVNGTPSVGAVAEWNGGNPGIPFPGHVAVVEEVGKDVHGTYIVISQQNISGDTDGYEWRMIRKGSNVWQSWPDNFIHFQIPKRALPGYYNPTALTANFRFSQTAGPINTGFPLGAKGTLPLVGNWSSTGTGRTGYYDPATGTFYLHNVSTATPNVAVIYGPPSQLVKPLVGDWKGTGLAGIGYYDPATGTFHLRQALTAGADDFTIQFGPTTGGVIPLAGDWTGGKQDGIGYFVSATGQFALATITSATTATRHWLFKVTGAAKMVPIVGNWTGTKTDYVGYYNPSNGNFYLRDSLTAGGANTVIHLNPTPSPSKMIPLTGDWYGG